MMSIQVRYPILKPAPLRCCNLAGKAGKQKFLANKSIEGQASETLRIGIYQVDT
jgi:hypothetical protein